MATIVTRAGKGSPLTHDEVDDNFDNLNTDKVEIGGNVSSLTNDAGYTTAAAAESNALALAIALG